MVAVTHALIASENNSGGLDTYTKLLLHCNGTNGSTTFTDSSWANRTVGTVNGNAQISTAQSKFGGASALFDGTGDSLDFVDSSDFAFGSGDFTVDFHFWIIAGSAAILYDSRATDPSIAPTIYYTTPGPVLRFYVNGADRITATTTLSTGQWYHCAVARSGTSTKLFLNGTQEGSTYTDSNTYINGTARPRVGDAGVGTFGHNGYVEELRVSKGVARWTTGFTVPTIAYG